MRVLILHEVNLLGATTTLRLFSRRSNLLAILACKLWKRTTTPLSGMLHGRIFSVQ